MRMLSRSVLLAATALSLGSGLAAQQIRDNGFQWYVGGQGGAMSFETPNQARTTKALGGASLLVMAHRSGLLLSFDQGFTKNSTSAYGYVQLDSAGQVTSTGTVDVTFNYVRRYAAMLMAYPVRGPISPFFGLGGGIMHVGGLTAFGSSTDDGITKDMGSSAFGSALAGLEIRLSRVAIFGQYQISTEMSSKSRTVPLTDGSQVIYSGRLLTGPVHTFSAGLRVSLGNARESIDEQR